MSPSLPCEGGLALVESLRADLHSARYTVAGVEALLGARAAAALHREQPTAAELATSRMPGRLATLVRLFALGRPASKAEVEAACPRTGCSGLARMGLVDRDQARGEGQGVRALADLRPYADETHDWWVASDLSEIAPDRPLPAYHVLGIGPASTTLASWTPRPAARRTLDIGTGSGVQALHLSAHADQIVATDTSARALGLGAAPRGTAGHGRRRFGQRVRRGLTADQALVAIASLLGQDTDLVRASLLPVLAELVGYGLARTLTSRPALRRLSGRTGMGMGVWALVEGRDKGRDDFGLRQMPAQRAMSSRHAAVCMEGTARGRQTPR